jgi:hypothetical protein
MMASSHAAPSRLIGDRGRWSWLCSGRRGGIALDPAERQWQVLGPERVIGCVTEPGVIRQDGKGAAHQGG